MRVIEAIEPFRELSAPAVFLAGGITGCPDWQSEAISLFRDGSGTILNPRRPNFPVGDLRAAPQQIAWEHRGLRYADVILFWFPADQIQPIALFELGAWSAVAKRIVVGCSPSYPRRLDVEVQMGLTRPGLSIWRSLGETVFKARRELEAA